MLRVDSSNSSLFGTLRHVKVFIHLELITGKVLLVCKCGSSNVFLNGCILFLLLIAKALPHLWGPDEECTWCEVPRAREGGKGMLPQRQLDNTLLFLFLHENFQMYQSS